MNVVVTGTRDNAVVLHWNEVGTTWAVLSWRDWLRFRGTEPGEHKLLAGAEAGEHYFLVCVPWRPRRAPPRDPATLRDVDRRTALLRFRRARGGGTRRVIAY